MEGRSSRGLKEVRRRSQTCPVRAQQRAGVARVERESHRPLRDERALVPHAVAVLVQEPARLGAQRLQRLERALRQPGELLACVKNRVRPAFGQLALSPADHSSRLPRATGQPRPISQLGHARHGCARITRRAQCSSVSLRTYWLRKMHVVAVAGMRYRSSWLSLLSTCSHIALCCTPCLCTSSMDSTAPVNAPCASIASVLARESGLVALSSRERRRPRMAATARGPTAHPPTPMVTKRRKNV